RNAGWEAISSPSSMPATRAATSTRSDRKLGWISSAALGSAVLNRRYPLLRGRTSAGTMLKVLGGKAYCAAISFETKGNRQEHLVGPGERGAALPEGSALRTVEPARRQWAPGLEAETGGKGVILEVPSHHWRGLTGRCSRRAAQARRHKTGLDHRQRRGSLGQ